MAIECPKCQADNTDTAHFCSNCSASLHDEDLHALHTKTIETPREELTTGSTFAERYQIIEELGKGGMGKVYRVLDKKLNEEVALKLIKSEIASDKKTVERFSNELKLTRKMVHKNVARMFDLNEEKGTLYITMEYVRGEDLKRLIRKIGQLSVGQAIPIAKQTCEGLTEAHRSGVVHRDLKPQNIMVDEDGNARIMDFGIARSLKGKSVTAAGVMIGTPEYMSPEQVEGKEVDQRSDIYSLGIILYEMVTGRVPFEGDTPFTIGVKHKSEMPQDPKELNAQIPEDLSRVILKCLEKDKEQRYRSTGEVRTELANIERGIPTTERVVPKRKPLTSREITVTLGVKKLWIPALIFLGVIAAGLIFWQFVLKDGAIPLPSEKKTIAVISFENMTQDKVYDHLRKTIPNLLITSLEQSGYFHVATWERMHDLLKQTGKEEVEFIDRDLGFELCSLEGIDTIVLGSFAKAGEMFATDVKVLDVASKTLLKSASSRGEGEGSILKNQIDELSQEIARGIGVSERKIASAQAKIANVTTSSIEAYEYYLKAREAEEKLYRNEARQHLEKAVELDPDFALAYLELAGANQALGNTNARNDAIDRAILLSTKASKKERLYIEAWYHFFREPDPEKGEKLLKQLIAEFPKEKEAHFWLAVHYDNIGLFDQALAGYNKALELDPNYTDVINMIAYTYLSLRNYDKALEYFERYASRLPDDPNPIDSVAELYLHMGRLDDAIAKYKETLEIKPDFGSQLPLAYIFSLKENYKEAIKWIDDLIETAPSQGIMADGNIWKGFYYYWLGRLDHSLEFIQKGITLADSIGNVSRKLRANGLLGWIYYDQGLLESSRQYLEIWLDLYQKNYPVFEADYSAQYNFLLGMIALKEGRINEAQSRASEIESFLSDVQAGTKETVAFNYLGAEIQLTVGSLEDAIKVCEKSTPLRLPARSGRLDGIFYNLPFLRDTKARAYQKKGDLDKAIDEYEQLIVFNPDSKERRLIHPKYHYRLAILYEQKGWPGKAIEHYQRFLDLWKEADPGITEVVDAKKRLAGLQ